LLNTLILAPHTHTHSVAVGEYISVAGQRDAEEADIQKERDEQAKGPAARAHELEELTEIYINRCVARCCALTHSFNTLAIMRLTITPSTHTDQQQSVPT
jgi:hypothetical protein